MFNRESAADKWAIVLSALCILHCLLTPILVMAIPVVAGISLLQGETLHIALLFLVVPISLLAIMAGYGQHKNPVPLVLALIGLVLLVCALTLADDWLGHEAETPVTIIGSVFIVAGHIKNLTLRKRPLVSAS